MKIRMQIDKQNQWFTNISVVVDKRIAKTEFKIDTGCNCLLLSHITLQKLGLCASDIAKLPDAAATSVSERIPLKRVGKVSLYYGKNLIGTFDAHCHATRSTNDLLGSPILQKFKQVHFDLTAESTMTLLSQ